MSQGYYGDEAAGYGDQPPVPKGNAPAVISMICGLLGCLCVTAPLAVIFGIVGLRKTRDPYVTGKGMAITGLVLGTIWLVALGSCGTIIGVFWSKFGDAYMTTVRFAVNMSQGNVDAALAETRGIGRDTLAADSDKLKGGGQVVSLSPSHWSMDAVAGQPTTVRFSGVVIYPGGKNSPYSMTLIKEGNRYKITEYEFK